jgi:hypothetical protein
MIKELEQIVLTADFPEHGLVSGDLGTVVDIYVDGEAYEVEFMTLDGDTVAVVTVRKDQLRAIGAREIPHARAVS